ncbi:Hypothetical protein PBC10988_6340 [Planctomycetales bacterium 10988]|nr:Hypothetical protein PBC10988_6340 [Planctomycetales bacterium 10988]
MKEHETIDAAYDPDWWMDLFLLEESTDDQESESEEMVEILSMLRDDAERRLQRKQEDPALSFIRRAA